MTRISKTLSAVLACACVATSPLYAQDAPATRPATQPSSETQSGVARGITVAVINFEANTPGSPELGSQIGEVLTASLTGEPGFRLLDRAQMNNVLRENELNLTGLVNGDQATKVGKLVGAKILITGRAFTLDKQIFITAKLIGTETTLVDGIVVKGSKEADTGELVMQLAAKVAERLNTAGPKLVAADDDVTDPLPGLKEKLAGRALPKVAIDITERHLNRTDPSIDPAVDTEVKKILIAAGFTVVDGGAGEWEKGGVEMTINGEAFSEFNVRIGNLVSCSARTEIKMVSRKEGRVLFADRSTTRSVDLAENVAGKTALQKGGREIGIRLLEHFAETLPPAK